VGGNADDEIPMNVAGMGTAGKRAQREAIAHLVQQNSTNAEQQHQIAVALCRQMIVGVSALGRRAPSAQ
jgi:hypothetical protein